MSVAIRDFDDEYTEWVMKITKFIVYGPTLNRYHFFVDGQYYAAISLEIDLSLILTPGPMNRR